MKKAILFIVVCIAVNTATANTLMNMLYKQCERSSDVSECMYVLGKSYQVPMIEIKKFLGEK